MRVHTLVREQELPGTPAEVFGLFADARNLEAITPPLLRFEVVTPGDIEMQVGTLMTDTVRYAIGFGPVGELAHRAFVRRDVEAIFDFRGEAIGPLLAQR